MKNYLKFLYTTSKEYIFIFLTASIFLLTYPEKSIGEENVFTINDIEIIGEFNTNFSREKYLNEGFLNSFETLINKILLTRDLKKTNDIKLNKIKSLIKSFQIIDENYLKNVYQLKIKVIYNEQKVKKFLREKNISFSQSENISVIFYPIIFINNEIKSFEDNFFYMNWKNVKIKNELINYILPLEDLEDINKILKNKDKIEELNINSLVNKYDIENYVFALMDYENENGNLNIYLKTNFRNNKLSKNILYKISNIKDKLALEIIIKKLKLSIIDLWKEENLINLLMPLSINIKYKHTNINDISKFSATLNKMNIVDSYSLEQFDINSSLFKIYYYGSPKKLKSKLSSYGYNLSNDQGFWQVY